LLSLRALFDGQGFIKRSANKRALPAVNRVWAVDSGRNRKSLDRHEYRIANVDAHARQMRK
jgi:hypothetical protein